MKFGYKIILVAVLAMLSGIAFAVPLLILPIDIEPYPHVPQGPKADFSIELVYADFNLNSWTQNDIIPQWALNSTTYEFYIADFIQQIQYTNITYTVVANITNFSNLVAQMSETTFAAAQKINIEPTVLGGVSFGTTDPWGPQTNFGGVAPGVYLDGKWVSTTWIPGKDYPYNLFPIMDSQHWLSFSTPELPQNASEIGTWMEGVPIAEYYDSTHLAATHMYINGAWVDVTGRVTPGIAQPMVLSQNTLVSHRLSSSTPIYRNEGNKSVGPVTDLPGWSNHNGNGPRSAFIQATFDRTWQPQQSKLIIFTGTYTVSNDSGIPDLLTLMENGTIDLFGSITNYITNMPIDNVYTNTVSTATWLQTVPLEKTLLGYRYNAVLAPGEIFQIAPNGIEATIREVN